MRVSQQVLVQRVDCGCRPWWQRWEIAVEMRQSVARFEHDPCTAEFRSTEVLGYSMTRIGGSFKARVLQRSW